MTAAGLRIRTTGPPSLARLAAERATGALAYDGGTLYLVDGEVVHAESPAAPGIEVLLTTGGRLPAESWREAVDRAAPRHGVGRHLVETGRLTGGELEICHLGTLFDAAFFALAPGGRPVRFRPGAAHWLGPVRPVRAAAVERETRRRLALLARLWPWEQVDTAPVVVRERDAAAPSRPGERTPADQSGPVATAAAVTRRQRAVLNLADGVRTPGTIARLLGRPAFSTLLDVRRLAAARYIETPHTSHTPHTPAPSAAPPGSDRGAELCDDPDIALLRRLRDALEAHL